MAKDKPKNFKFNEEQYDITKKTYVEILKVLGIAKNDKQAEKTLSTIPVENGEAFEKYLEQYYLQNEPDEKTAIKKRQETATKALADPKNKQIGNNTKMYLAHMMNKYMPFDTVLTSGIMIGPERRVFLITNGMCTR